MIDLDNQLSETRKYVEILNTKFIAPHIPANPSTTPDVYEFDVKSYIILSHAAIEEFFEAAALYVVEKSIDHYFAKTLTKPLLSILSSFDKRLEIPKDEQDPDTKSFDNIRRILTEFKSYYSRFIHQNHGASLTYMRNMFYPISIDIPNDLRLVGAINWIAEFRGSFAHTRRGKIPSPEDCKNYLDDCLLLCENIKDQAINLVKT